MKNAVHWYLLKRGVRHSRTGFDFSFVEDPRVSVVTCLLVSLSGLDEIYQAVPLFNLTIGLLLGFTMECTCGSANTNTPAPPPTTVQCTSPCFYVPCLWSVSIYFSLGTARSLQPASSNHNTQAFEHDDTRPRPRRIRQHYLTTAAAKFDLSPFPSRSGLPLHKVA